MRLGLGQACGCKYGITNELFTDPLESVVWRRRSRIRDQGSEIRDQGSGDQGSGIRYLVPRADLEAPAGERWL